MSVAETAIATETEYGVSAPVLELPSDARDPVVVPSPFDCGRALGVLSYDGAEVRIVQDDPNGDLFMGAAYVSSDLHHVEVPTVAFRAGTQVRALQRLPDRTEQSTDYTPVLLPNGLPSTPRPMRPFAVGHDQVYVSAVNPGAAVWVRHRLPTGDLGPVLGWRVVTDPVARLSTLPLGGDPLVAQSSLCEPSELSDGVEPMRDPGEPGDFAVAQEALVGRPGGQLYYPVDPATGLVDPTRIAPLVVIGTGQAPYDGIARPDSYLGYEWLGEHLASHGMVVFSLQPTGTEEASAPDFVNALSELLSGAFLPAKVAPIVDATSPVFLVGQSNGGKSAFAVVQPVANGGAYGLTGIAGLVLLTTEEIPLVEASPPLTPGTLPPTLHVSSRYDYSSGGYRYAEVGLRPSGVVMIERGDHNGFNTFWRAYVEDDPSGAGEVYGGDLLPMEEQQAIAKSMIAAYLLGLSEDEEHLRWLVAPARPAAFGDLEVHRRFRALTGPEPRGLAMTGRYLHGGPLVIDNFGNPDPQLFQLGTPGGTTTDANTLGYVNRFDVPGPIENATLEANSFALGLALPAPLPGYYATQVGVPSPKRQPMQEVGPRDAIRLTGGSEPEISEAAQDFLVTVEDWNGVVSGVRAGAISPVPRLTELGVQGPEPPRTPPTTTLDLPLDAFVAANSQLAPRELLWATVTAWSQPKVRFWMTDLEVVS